MRCFQSQNSLDGSFAACPLVDDGNGDDDVENRERLRAEMDNGSTTWDNDKSRYSPIDFKVGSEPDMIGWLQNDNDSLNMAPSSPVTSTFEDAESVQSNKHHHRTHSLEPVIVPRRRLATACTATAITSTTNSGSGSNTAPNSSNGGGNNAKGNPSSRHCSRWVMGGFPSRETMAIELSKGFREPASRSEPPTRDRVLGGVSEKPCSPPPEDVARQRPSRDDDRSRERLFGASEELLSRGIKEWPIRSYRQPKHRPRPGDDSRRKVCWWVASPAVSDENFVMRHKKAPPPTLRAVNSSTGDRVFGTSVTPECNSPHSSQETSPVHSPLLHDFSNESIVTTRSLPSKIRDIRNPISGEGVIVPPGCLRSQKALVHRNPISGDGILSADSYLRVPKHKSKSVSHHFLLQMNEVAVEPKKSSYKGGRRNPIIGEGCQVAVELKSHRKSDSRLNPITGQLF